MHTFSRHSCSCVEPDLLQFPQLFARVTALLSIALFAGIAAAVLVWRNGLVPRPMRIEAPFSLWLGMAFPFFSEALDATRSIARHNVAGLRVSSAVIRPYPSPR